MYDALKVEQFSNPMEIFSRVRFQLLLSKRLGLPFIGSSTIHNFSVCLQFGEYRLVKSLDIY